MRIRKIKKIGGSLFIALTKADIDDFIIKEGDYIDIEDCLKINLEFRSFKTNKEYDEYIKFYNLLDEKQGEV
jgi:hypothetical protein